MERVGSRGVPPSTHHTMHFLNTNAGKKYSAMKSLIVHTDG